MKKKNKTNKPKTTKNPHHQTAKPQKNKEMEEPTISLDWNSPLSEKLPILLTQMNKILLKYFVF